MSTVGDILARKGHEVISVRPTATVLTAANLMNERGIGGVLVIEGEELGGIFTERDVLRRVVAQGRDPATTLVSSVMSTPVTGTEPSMSIDECAALMTERRIRHLPVHDPSGIVGMITIGDLLAFQVSEQQTTIQQMNNYIYDLR